VLAQPWVHVVLSGAAAVEQLHGNLAARELAWDDDVARELEPLAEPGDLYWSRRSNLSWN
jgi:aryl-alcohol dehydrogenase-like predicted oxidoreductase